MNNKDYSSLYQNSINTLRIATPIIGSRLIAALLGFINMWLIALLGHQAVAAGALISSVSGAITMFACSPLFAVSIYVGQAYGANKYHEIGSYIRAAFVLGLVLGIPATILYWHIGPILLLTGQEPHLVALAIQYFRPSAWGIIPFMWIVILVQLAIGTSRPKLLLFWNVLGLPLMLLPGYALLFGKLHLPKLGIAGMGYANSIANWLLLIIIIVHLIRLNLSKKYALFAWRKLFTWKQFREILNFGAFITIQIGGELFTFMLATLMIGHFGESALAARQITIQIASLLLVIPYGLSQANCVVISQAYGRFSNLKQRAQAVKASAYAALVLGGIFGLIMALVFILAPKLIIGFYIDPNATANVTTVHLATLFLLITAIFQCVDILRVIATGSLRGMFDTVTPMFVSVFISCFLGLPLGYILAFVCKWGPSGVLWGFVVTCSIGALILITRISRSIVKLALGSAAEAP